MVGGLSGQRMLIGLLIGIIVLVVLVLKTKIHAFLALIMSAVIIGLVGGMPMVNVTLENGKTLASSTRLQPASAVHWEALVLLSVSVS